MSGFSWSIEMDKNVNEHTADDVIEAALAEHHKTIYHPDCAFCVIAIEVDETAVPGSYLTVFYPPVRKILIFKCDSRADAEEAAERVTKKLQNRMMN